MKTTKFVIPAVLLLVAWFAIGQKCLHKNKYTEVQNERVPKKEGVK